MQSKRRLSNWKKLVYFFIFFSGVLLVSEGFSRVIFYINEGFNPYYLTFGFVHDVETHSLEADGYSKFQPNTYKHQIVQGETLAIKINSQGFRGVRNFVDPKPSNVFRIVTLGACSAFGFYVKDDEFINAPAQVGIELKSLAAGYHFIATRRSQKKDHFSVILGLDGAGIV